MARPLYVYLAVACVFLAAFASSSMSEAKASTVEELDRQEVNKEAAAKDEVTSPAQCQSKNTELQATNTELQATNTDKDRKIAELQADKARIMELQTSKELGDKAGWDTTTGAGADLQGCANAANCNPAKCHGDTQDNSQLYGHLDCESGARSAGYGPGKGSECLDNLSSGMFYTNNKGGAGACLPFDGELPTARTTQYVEEPGHVRDGVIVKMVVAHPHKAWKRYGLIGAKRIVCVGSSCSVFKVGMCIKCPKTPYRDAKEHKATQQDHSKFVQCCIKGESTYKLYDTAVNEGESTPSAPCPAGSGTGAFTAVNDASATLKPSYECWNGDDTDTGGKWAHAASEATLKAL